MKGNIHKKMTFEDHDDFKYIKRKGKFWAYYKRRNRKLFRKMIKREEVIND